jgi:2,4-dienoyl-CoA reductase-like NADH-dependent reductase (Old Yellow Enzyme family)
MARYARLARGGWGVVFVEATSVTPTSLGRLRGLVITHRTAESLRGLVDRFKELHPQGLLLIQLTHSGPQSHPQSERSTVSLDPPSGMRALSTEEIEGIRGQFVEAALLAEEVGFDGIDYKLCHGYLGTELLRPANTRGDRWGGSFENRTRFLTEGIEEIKARRRRGDFILGARITFYEKRPGGFGTAGPDSEERDLSEPMALVRLLSRLGMAYVNVGDSGEAPDHADSLEPEERQVGALYYERLAKELVVGEGLALTVIGSGYSALREQAPDIATRRLRAGRVDLIGFGRQILADPLYPQKLWGGEAIAYCVGCGACGKLMLSHHHAGCAVREPYYRELLRTWRRGE